MPRERPTREPHRQHRKQCLPTGDDAGIVAVLCERVMRFGKCLRAQIVEAGRLHPRSPNRRANRPRFSPPALRASAAKNCRITILAAPSSKRPPIDATLPPISAS